MAQKPLMLKDFLEIDANSESCDGFLCMPRRPETATVRSLLEIELGGKLIRTRSKGALSKMTAVINAVNIFSSAESSRTEGRFLSRSFQKKLRRTLCKKKKKTAGEEDQAAKVHVGVIMRLTSIKDEEVDRISDGFPSPVVSRCSSSSESQSDTESDFGRNGGDNGVETSNGVLSRTDIGFGADYQEAVTGSRDQQSDNMTHKWHIYMTKGRRISLAGLSLAKCEYLADAIIDSFHNVS